MRLSHAHPTPHSPIWPATTLTNDPVFMHQHGRGPGHGLYRRRAPGVCAGAPRLCARAQCARHRDAVRDPTLALPPPAHADPEGRMPVVDTETSSARSWRLRGSRTSSRRTLSGRRNRSARRAPDSSSLSRGRTNSGPRPTQTPDPQIEHLYEEAVRYTHHTHSRSDPRSPRPLAHLCSWPCSCRPATAQRTASRRVTAICSRPSSPAPV